MRTILLSLVTLAVFAACDAAPRSTGEARQTKGRSRESLTIQGSSTMLHLSSDWGEKFMLENPGFAVSVTGGGSGTGIAALLNGTTDIANASRKIRETEVAQARLSALETEEIVVAKDGITVVVHPSNPLTRLSADQLRRIFNGDLEDWTEIGGPSSPMLVLSRDSSSGTHVVFKNIAMGGDEYRPDARFVASNSAIVSSVSSNPGAIGYIGYGFLRQAGDRVRALAIEGPAGYASPTEEGILDGSYTISRELYFYVPKTRSSTAHKFIDFVLNEEGQRIVAERGFVRVR